MAAAETCGHIIIAKRRNDFGFGIGLQNATWCFFYKTISGLADLSVDCLLKQRSMFIASQADRVKFYKRIPGCDLVGKPAVLVADFAERHARKLAMRHSAVAEAPRLLSQFCCF